MALSKNTVKYIKSLQAKKFRQKYNNFVLEGDKIAREILQQETLEIEACYAIAPWIEANRSLLQRFSDKIHTIDEADLKKISGLTTPNQVLVIAKQPQIKLDSSELQQNLTLYLDAIQDPGNMGTIIRIADWFGLPYVFCSRDCADVFSPKVVQATMGALLRVKTLEIKLIDLQKQTSDLPVLGAVLNGVNIFSAKLPREGILVIGNESQGISQEIEALLTHRIAIPPAASGGAESLNAAVATGIIVALLKNIS